MCGISGIVGRVDEHELRRMTQFLYHRGPDDGAVWLSPSGAAGLGHRRLRIIDLTDAARQPMRSQDGRHTLVYNGEIFNFQELRRDLEGRGHTFRTRSDSEVLLAAWVQWGDGLLQRLVGQFAFAVWDETERALFAARDHLGVKPLYYTRENDGLLFASEIKALLAARPALRTARREALPGYLAYLWNAGDETFFPGVYRLAPGCWLRYRNGELHTGEYWNPADAARRSVQGNDTQRAAEFRARFGDAVVSQLASDVPLGLLLSGGLDSTALLAAIHAAGSTVRALTATYTPESRARDVFDDDLPFAREAAVRFDTPLDVRALDADVPALLARAVWHLDEPLADPTVVTNLALTAAAKSDMTVLLSGMGADEILAGYPRYPAAMLAGRIPGAGPLLRGAARAAAALEKRGGLSAGTARRAQFLAAHADKPFFERFLGYSTYWDAAGQNELFARDLAVTDHDLSAAHRRIFEHHADLSPLTRLLIVDLRLFLPHLNLENMDKTSMANAVEMRVPFLDHRLVEFALALPDGDKLRGTTRKHVLRRAFRSEIPQSILHRRKTGYSPPVRSWVRTTLREEMRDVLFSAQARGRGLWNAPVLERCFHENDEGTRDHSMKLWQLYVLEHWFRTFIDTFPAEPPHDPASLARVD